MSVTENDLEILKLNLQEKTPDVFTVEDLEALLVTHQNVWLASYFGCQIKATVNANIELPGGLKIEGNSEYWTKLADTYYSKYKTELLEQSKNKTIGVSGYKNSMSRADEFIPPWRRW